MFKSKNLNDDFVGFSNSYIKLESVNSRFEVSRKKCSSNEEYYLLSHILCIKRIIRKMNKIIRKDLI